MCSKRLFSDIAQTLTRCGFSPSSPNPSNRTIVFSKAWFCVAFIPVLGEDRAHITVSEVDEFSGLVALDNCTMDYQFESSRDMFSVRFNHDTPARRQKLIKQVVGLGFKLTGNVKKDNHELWKFYRDSPRTTVELIYFNLTRNYRFTIARNPNKYVCSTDYYVIVPY